MLREAHACLTLALRQEPDNGAAAFELGRVLVWQTGADDEAQRRFLHAAQLDPHNTPAMQAITELAHRRATSTTQSARWLRPLSDLGYQIGTTSHDLDLWIMEDLVLPGEDDAF